MEYTHLANYEHSKLQDVYLCRSWYVMKILILIFQEGKSLPHNKIFATVSYQILLVRDIPRTYREECSESYPECTL
jgi:hypothetical protein